MKIPIELGTIITTTLTEVILTTIDLQEIIMYQDLITITITI
jgi:hypothetical protein